MACGNFCYDVDDGDRLIHLRSNSLFMWKMAVSCYMPNSSPWIELVDGSGFGNLTKSAPVKNLIKEVEKFEVRNEGAPSGRKWDFRKIEFRKMLEMIARQSDIELALICTCVSVLQCNIIGRIADVSNFAMKDPPGHPEF